MDQPQDEIDMPIVVLGAAYIAMLMGLVFWVA